MNHTSKTPPLHNIHQHQQQESWNFTKKIAVNQEKKSKKSNKIIKTAIKSIETKGQLEDLSDERAFINRKYTWDLEGEKWKP